MQGPAPTDVPPPRTPSFEGSEDEEALGAATTGISPPSRGDLGSLSEEETRTTEAEATTAADAGAPPHADADADGPAVADLATRAAKLYGTTPADVSGVLGRVRALLAKWGRAWVDAAIRRAEAKAARGGLDNPFGYIHRTLEGFRGEGGPPPPKAAKKTVSEILAGIDLGDL